MRGAMDRNGVLEVETVKWIKDGAPKLTLSFTALRLSTAVWALPHFPKNEGR